MKKILHVLLFIVSLALLLLTNEVKAQDKVPIANEDVSFVVSNSQLKLIGKMDLAGGNFDLDNGFITGGTIVFDLRSLSIENARSIYEKYHIERAIKSSTFLDTRAYPIATLTFKAIKPTFSESGNSYIVGDMTIKGVTKEIEFKANFLWEDEQAKGAGRVNLQLEDFDIYSMSTDGKGNRISFVFRISSDNTTEAELFNEEEDIDLNISLDSSNPANGGG